MVIKNINYYLANPELLLEEEPMTRGGDFKDVYANLQKNTILPSGTKQDKLESKVKLYPIDRDLYECGYHPDRHKILYNHSFPRVQIKVGGKSNPVDLTDDVKTISWQKVIHNLHVQPVTVKPLEITLINKNPTDKQLDNSKMLELRWERKHLDSVKAMCVSRQKRCGDVGLLFRYDSKKNKVFYTVFSHVDGNKHVIENKNEYGEVESRSLHYIGEDKTEYIDTFDDEFMYRHIKVKDDGKGGADDKKKEWEFVSKELHGFPECPLLYKRGYVAWEFAQSTIELHEFLLNIYYAVVRKYGTLGLVTIGRFDESNIQGDEVMLVYNIDNPESGADIKTLEYPEPKGLKDLIDYCLPLIEMQASVTNVNIDRLNTGSGDNSSGSALQIAMRNDLGLAEQTSTDWEEFTDSMFRLFVYGEGLIDGNVGLYSDLEFKTRLSVWLPQSRTALINELNILKSMGAVSLQTICDHVDLCNPDEKDRVKRDRDEDLEYQKALSTVTDKAVVEDIVVEN